MLHEDEELDNQSLEPDPSYLYGLDHTGTDTEANVSILSIYDPLRDSGHIHTIAVLQPNSFLSASRLEGLASTFSDLQEARK